MSARGDRKEKKRHSAPNLPGFRPESGKLTVTVFEFEEGSCKEVSMASVDELMKRLPEGHKAWINISGVHRSEIQQLCDHYGIDPLVTEDMLSTGEQAKIDEIGDFVSCLMPFPVLQGADNSVLIGQVGIVLGKDLLFSFQDDPEKDAFTEVYNRLRKSGGKLQQQTRGFLCYALLDTIVDGYFTVIEKVGEQIEAIEDVIPDRPDSKTLYKMDKLRRSMLSLRRSMSPVRGVINGFIRNDSELIDEDTEKYFKDVYDHVIQANELTENYQEMMLNMQDLYLSNMDLRMNGIMKVLTIVTTLVMPPTLIAGIYGMNFKDMPGVNNPHGFYICMVAMLFITILMLIWFKKKNWF